MGACGVAALVVLLLASALLPSTASSRVLEGEASSGKGAPVPTDAAGGSSKSDKPKESGQSSTAGKQAESKSQQEAPSPTKAPKDSKLPSTGDSENQGQGGGDAQVSVTSPPPPPPVKKDVQKESPPPPPVQENDVPKESPPPPQGGSGPNDGGEAKGGTDHEDMGNQGKDDDTEKMTEVMKKCDGSRSPKCSVGDEFSACLQVSDNASISSFVIVLNKGRNDITVNVKEASNVDIDKNPLSIAKGAFGQMGIRSISPNGGEVILNDGNGDCTLHVGQSVSDWQQQFQQFADYATHLNPIYGAYLFGFTVVLVGAVCLCCKFARKRGNGGVPYQQLEMSAPAPNASGADNTTSTADGWDEGWDDDWDDEEAPARPSDKNTASSVSGNGLSLRSHANNKDGWDVDWDD